MSNYNTGNPVPSTDPRDLDDNATAFDRLMNSMDPTALDRLGAPRKTWRQMEQDAAALVAPNVSALAAAVSGANKLFYFTGSGVGTVADFTDDARTLLAADSQGDQRTALGLGGLAVLNTATVATGGTGATTAAAARVALGVRNASTAYIDGLEMTWAASSVSVSAGAAYAPGIARLVESSASITVNFSGLTNGTFYHLYLYDNAGVAAVELSATAPVAAATGGFTKTADSSRRYIGSILANGATSCHRFFQDGNRIYYNVSDIAAAPFGVLAAQAVEATVVSCAGCVPVTGKTIVAMLNNASTAALSTVRIGNPDLGTVAAANHRQYVNLTSSYQGEILLSGTQQFSYIFDSAPNANFTVRVNGYVFQR